MLEKESYILDLESRLTQEIQKMREIEQQLIIQNSELESLLDISECNDLNSIFPEEFSKKIPENKEITLQVR